MDEVERERQCFEDWHRDHSPARSHSEYEELNGTKISSTAAKYNRNPEVQAPDGGWAWVVLASCFYCTLVSTSLSTAFGIQFVRFLTTVGASTTVTAWIANIHVVMICLVPAVAGPLILHFGWREIALFTSLGMTFFFFLLAFASSAFYLLIVYGIFLGLFEGMTLSYCFIILPYYFHKKRGLALGLQAVSISVGQIISPLFIRYLLTEFGFRGSIIIETGVVFNCCVAAALLRPLKQKEKQSSTANLANGSSSDGKLKNIEIKASISMEKEQEKNANSFKIVWLKMKTNVVHSFAGFKSYRVMLYAITNATFLCGYMNFATLLPFAMFNEGHDYGYAAVALSIAAISSTSARVMVSFTADRKWFPKYKVYTVMTLLSAVMCFCIILVLPNVYLIYGLMFIWGFGVGVLNSLKMEILITLIGMELYVPSIGTSGMVTAVTFLTTGPFIGFIRDVSMSYPLSIGLCAFLQLICPVMWFFLPLFLKLDDKRLKKSSERNSFQI